MASPIIKIKRGSGRPPTYQISGTTQLGLTAGELGVNLNVNNSGYVLYIGNTFGTAITFAAEIDTNPNLGDSDVKVATQKALKDYVAAYAPPSNSITQVTSRYMTSGAQPVAANTVATLLFNSVDFQSPVSGISNLTYNTATGLFTYTGTSTIYVMINYQITWAAFASTQSYTSRNIVRSGWIEKTATDIYGFSTILLPPLIQTSVGAITGTHTGSALISLSQNETFSVKCKNHGSAPFSVVAVGSVNNAGTLGSNFERATRVQITKL